MSANETCPACGEVASSGANWCEACGHDLAETNVVGHETGAAPEATPDAETASAETASTETARTETGVPCQACGALEVGADGYCLSCGYRQPSERNHMTETVGSVAAATDRGTMRHQNEDAFAIAVSDAGHSVLVVCDGVGSTPGSDQASTSASQVACQAVVNGLHGVDPTAESDIVEAEVEKVLMSAVAEAQQAATAAAEAVAGSANVVLTDPPSTTLICAVAATNGDSGSAFVNLHVAWVGDSRCYWVTNSGQELLTVDHEEMGALSKWLGADSIDPEPDVAHYRFAATPGPDGGVVMACSDGLWRYLTPATGMTAHELVAAIRHPLRTADAGDVHDQGRLAQQLAEGAIDFANNQGGHDNITVAIAIPTRSQQQEDP